ncbi:MAG: metallophosphoesterase family protein [Proteobacteria bacterium]|nr:metallophosphoesterase family protein [Pseudomonadota bacterium]
MIAGRLFSGLRSRSAGVVGVLVLLVSAWAVADQAQTSIPKGAQTRFIYPGDAWRYDLRGVHTDGAWRGRDFDDSHWQRGEGSFGFGAARYGLATRTRVDDTIHPTRNTVYLRKQFEVRDPKAVAALELEAAWSHGFVAYLNGVEVVRRGLPAGAIDYWTPAQVHAPTQIETIDISVARSALVAGNNVLAVELHQSEPGSDVLYWFASLAFRQSMLSLVRGPYLQQSTPVSTILRWRTNRDTVGLVAYGPSPGVIRSSEIEATSTARRDHVVKLNGLTPRTRYYYQIGAKGDGGMLAGSDGRLSFVTPPPVGSTAPLRIWAVGDAGTGNGTARAVRNAYYALKERDGRECDVFLMLGDNAYEQFSWGGGSDLAHQYGLFENAFEHLLWRTPVWPTFGNHEWSNGVSDPVTESGPYFDTFTLPRAAEAGGVPSGTEAYYSFDYGNVHFISMNTQEPTAASAAWLEQDLADSRALWVIAFYHVPPYSHGTHDSDQQGHVAAREFARILERHGADVVLAGHSHNYERSMLIKGLLGTSDEFVRDPLRYTVNGGDGREQGNGVYLKPGIRGPGQGTVYIVNGNSGGGAEALEGAGTLDHPVMVYLTDPDDGRRRRGLRSPGSVVIDVANRRLDARYIDASGRLLDYFSIVKQD